MFLAIAPDAQLQPVGKRVDHRHAHAVQATRNLVGIAVELTARMQLCHDDLSRRNTLFLVRFNRNTAAIIADRHAGICMNCDGHAVGMTRQGLVDTVIDDLIDHVMQTRAIIGIPDIHAWAFTDCF